MGLAPAPGVALHGTGLAASITDCRGAAPTSARFSGACFPFGEDTLMPTRRVAGPALLAVSVGALGRLLRALPRPANAPGSRRKLAAALRAGQELQKKGA